MASNLLEILPRYFRPILEYQVLMKIYGLTLDNLEALTEKFRSNLYIQTADAATLALYEKLLGITVTASDDIEDRRTQIMSLFASNLPYTEKKLLEILGAIYSSDGFKLEVDSINQTLSLYLINTLKFADNTYYTVRQMVPASLEMFVAGRFERSYEIAVSFSSAMASFPEITANPVGAVGVYSIDIDDVTYMTVGIAAADSDGDGNYDSLTSDSEILAYYNGDGELVIKTSDDVLMIAT